MRLCNDKLIHTVAWGGWALACSLFLLIYFEANLLSNWGWDVVRDNRLEQWLHDTWMTARALLMPLLVVLMALTPFALLLYIPAALTAMGCMLLRRSAPGWRRGRVAFSLLPFLLTIAGAAVFFPWAEMWRDRQQVSEGQRIVEAASGYEQALRDFEIHANGVGCWDAAGCSVNLIDLVPRKAEGIDALRWYMRVGGGVAKNSWLAPRDLYRHSLVLSRSTPGIYEWKAAAPGRTVEVWFNGDLGYAEEQMDFFVGTAWRHAGFVGQPELQVVLRRRGTACCELYLSSREPGALIVSAHSEGGAQPHWLDGLDVFYHPAKPYYIKVDARGAFEKRLIPQSDPDLSAALAEHGVRYQASPPAGR